MEENVQVELTKNQLWYARLDKYLLYLLTGELGYFILLIIAGIVMLILFNSIDIGSEYYKYSDAVFWPVLIYMLALPLNVIGGLASFVLNIRINHQGYPGTGHLLNWIYIITTGWIFLMGIIFMITSRVFD